VRQFDKSALADGPLGLLVLNRSMTPVFKNREALEACLHWNHGQDAHRRYDPAKAFAVPAPVMDTCREFAHRWATRESSADENELLRPIFLTHPKNPNWKLSVGIIRPKDFCLAQPLFLVRLVSHAEAESSTLNSSPSGALLMQKLTPSEQNVARAAVQGHSNYEISLKFGKTESTVKAQ
jgi:hypothetical protein